MTTTTRPLETGWLPDTPADDSVLRRFLANQADMQEGLVRAVAGRVERTPGVALTDCGSPAPYLNLTTLLRPVTRGDDPVLDEVSAFYRGRPAGMLLSAWPTPDLSGRGWRPAGHPMFVLRGPAGGRTSYGGPARDGVSVRIAETPADLALVERIVAVGYPMPQLAGAAANSVLGADLLGGPIVYRIGFLHDEPVAAAASHAAHGVANLCLAATLPAARRRGVWQALVDARCSDAPQLPAAAFTSDDSRPGFVRMGFLPVQRFTLWLVS